ncbi:MAG: hypothetical protein ACRDD1_07615 [Planctomycetia bacterium]
MRTKRVLVLTAVIGAALQATAGFADDRYYPFRGPTAERLPPTTRDWEELAAKQHLRAAHPGWCIEKVWLYADPIYYPRPPAAPCGTPSHTSFHGQYGANHPMPYYIPEPKIGFVAVPPWEKRGSTAPIVGVTPNVGRPTLEPIGGIESVGANGRRGRRRTANGRAEFPSAAPVGRGSLPATSPASDAGSVAPAATSTLLER